MKQKMTTVKTATIDSIGTTDMHYDELKKELDVELKVFMITFSLAFPTLLSLNWGFLRQLEGSSLSGAVIPIGICCIALSEAAVHMYKKKNRAKAIKGKTKRKLR